MVLAYDAWMMPWELKMGDRQQFDDLILLRYFSPFCLDDITSAPRQKKNVAEFNARQTIIKVWNLRHIWLVSN